MSDDTWGNWWSADPASLERMWAEQAFVEFREDIDQPHVVVRTDPATGSMTSHGPYPDVFSALAAIETDRLEWGPDVDPLTIRAVRCWPARHLPPAD
jgi:hypothetical protein